MVKRTLILIIALALFIGTSSSFGAYEWVLLDGELNIPRHALTGEALNGYVYAIGGIVSGGTAPSDSQNAVSRYDPATDSWTLVDSMPTARHSLSSAVIDGWIYAVGGHVVNSRSENQRYNGTSWESRASVYARSSPGVAAYNGELYVFGGNHYATMLSRFDIYNPTTDTWRYGGEIPVTGTPDGALTFDDNIYVYDQTDSGELWAYNPVADTWDTTSIPLMSVPHYCGEFQDVNGRIYAIGGVNGSSFSSSVESWAPGEESWRMEPSLNIARSNFASAVIGNDIYIFGGYNGGDLGSTEVLTLSEPPEEGPYICSIEPSSGAQGIDVTIKGFGFPANPWVNFGGIPRPVESWSENEVVVKVPPGKGVVDVYVTVMTGWPKSNPVKFTYKDPVINEIDPSSGRPGEKITIKGSDFGGPDPSPVIGDLFVKFGKSRARLITWIDKELVVEAPWDYGLGVTEEAILWLLKLIVSGWTGIPPEFLDPISDLIVELSDAGVEIREGEGTIVLGVYVENTVGRRSNTEGFTFYVPEIILALLRSPGELRVHDSQGNVTGLVDGEIKEEIAYSYCADNNVLIAYPSDSYTYEVVGTGYGPYGLSIISASDGEEITFEANEIPTSLGARHVYAVNWGALSAGDEGVVLNIDKNGDGSFEQMIIADNDLTSDEFALQTEVVIDFDPDTLNLQSKGKFVTVYIELPDDFDVSEIEISSLRLNELVPALPKPIEIGDYDSDGTNDLMVKFDLQELIEVLEPGEQIIDLTGRLWDGRPIAGFDFIRVIH